MITRSIRKSISDDLEMNEVLDSSITEMSEDKEVKTNQNIWIGMISLTLIAVIFSIIIIIRIFQRK